MTGSDLLGAFQVVGCTAGVVALTLQVRDALARRARPLPRATLWLSREQIPVEWLAGLGLAPSPDQRPAPADCVDELSGTQAAPAPKTYAEALGEMSDAELAHTIAFQAGQLAQIASASGRSPDEIAVMTAPLHEVAKRLGVQPEASVRENALICLGRAAELAHDKAGYSPDQVAALVDPIIEALRRIGGQR